VSTPVPAAVFKAGMVTDVGGVHDQSFNQSAWEGLARLQKDNPGKIEVSYLESIQESNYMPNLRKMSASGNGLIWGIGYLMAETVLECAAENPGQSFAVVDQGWSDTPPNVTGVTFRAQEPSFLVGYIAGKTTKTGKVGFVGGIKSFVTGQFEYGFRAGVKYAAGETGEEVEVLIQYAGTFSDDSAGKQIATDMYVDGADIVFHAAGGTGIGVINAAKELNKLAIGADRDQSYLAPDNVLTSAMKFVGEAMYDVSTRAFNGESVGGQTLSYGLKEGACGLPAYEGSTARLAAKEHYDGAMSVRDKIISGEITPPYDQETFEAFMAE
jgi:basic membrane protein A